MDNNKPNWQVTLLTLFPEMFPGPLGFSLAGKALAKSLWQLNTINIRDFAFDKRKTVDDYPYGGGAGMVIRPDVLGNAIEHIDKTINPKKIIYMSPRGTVLDQQKVIQLSKTDNLAIICGRFEGIDQRVLDKYEIEEISIGDYILSGGDIAAMVLIDTCLRLIPGIISNQETLIEESFTPYGEFAYLLEYPLYTKPYDFHGNKVPDILLSGNHSKIREWRLTQAKQITKLKRPDLWQKYLEDN